MSQIKTSSLVLATLLSLLIMALSGCGDKNSQVTLDPSTGKHPADWVATHWVGLQTTAKLSAKNSAKVVAATIDLGKSTCTQCHGADLLGGISKVSCFSAAIGAQGCHAEGPNLGHGSGWSQPSQHGRLGAMATPATSAGFAYCTKCHGSSFQGANAGSCFACHVTAPHPPKPWHGTTASGTNHVFTDPANADQCAKCHTGGANSDLKPTLAAAPGTAPGCFNNTLCHSSSHVAGWNDPTSVNFHSTTARSITSNCTLCHGTTLDGGTAPSCSNPNSSTGLKCHSNGKPIGTKSIGCTSCHGNPPDGSAFPNIKSSHDKHGNIAAVTCNTCHKGAGSGTSIHAKGTVIFSLFTTFKAKKATAVPLQNPNGTCANISCHGGNTTPAWNSANGLACNACHEQGSAYQVPEYNSYYSGTFQGTNLHSLHLSLQNPGTSPSVNITCTNCHDTSKLTNQQHYGGLAARTFVFPGNTIGGVNTRIGSYDASVKTCSGVSCHTAVPKNNINWFIF